MKRRNFLAAIIAGVTAPVLPATSTDATPLQTFMDEQFALRKQAKKFHQNGFSGAHAAAGRGMTASIYMVDESPFIQTRTI